MICRNCGYKMADDAVFCLMCGTKAVKSSEAAATVVEPVAVAKPVVEPIVEESVAVAEPTVEAAAEPSVETVFENAVVDQTPATENEEPISVAAEAPTPIYNPPAPKEKACKRGGWLRSIVASFLVVVVLAGACVGAFLLDRYIALGTCEELAQEYVDIMYFGQLDDIEDMIPDKLDEEHAYIIENWGNGTEMASKRSAALDKKFGTDITIGYTVYDCSRVFGSNKTVYYASIEDAHDIKITDGGSVFTFLLDVTVKGSTMTETYTSRMAAIEIGDEWYMFDIYHNCLVYVSAYVDMLDIDYEESDEHL